MTKNTLAGGGVAIGADESTRLRVVITGQAIIEFCLILIIAYKTTIYKKKRHGANVHIFVLKVLALLYKENQRPVVMNLTESSRFCWFMKLTAEHTTSTVGCLELPSMVNRKLIDRNVAPC